MIILNRKVYKVVVFNTTMFKINKGEGQTMNIRKAANLSLYNQK